MKKFFLKISINHPEINLELYEEGGGEPEDSICWEDKNNLSLKLLANIDKLLERNIIRKEQLNNIDVDSTQSTYSSTRIAQTIAKAGCYCLTNFSRRVE